MTAVERVISALEARGLKVSGSVERGWAAQCPSHDDRNASLAIGLGDGRALLCCHAGCTTDTVTAALGLETRDLFDNDSASAAREPRPSARPPAPLPTEAQVSEWAQRLSTQNGLLERLTKVRAWTREAVVGLGIGFDGERITFPVRDRERRLLNLCRYSPRPKAGERKMLSAAGRPRDLFPAPETIQGPAVWLVEGEPDAVAATSLGLPATALPGVEFAKRIDVSRFQRFDRVNVMLDCDPQGREAATRIAAKLGEVGVDTSVVDLDPSHDDGYDLGDYLRDAAEDGAEGLEHARRLLERMALATTPVRDPLSEDGTPHNGTGEGCSEDWPVLTVRGLPAFPVDALPSAVAAWVHATAEHTQTPGDLAALAALGVLSGAAIGGGIVDCGTWEEELALYLLVAMPSGDRKSTVLRTAVEPLRDVERDRQVIAKPRVRELRSRHDVLEVRARKLTKLAAEHSDPEQRLDAEQQLANVSEELDAIGEPAMPRLLANDATPEALGGLLARHGSIAVLAAESAFIDNIAGRYSDGKANLHLVCAAYSGESHTIDRKGHDPEQIDRPLVAIALTVQPHVLEALISHPIARAQGLVARFAYAMPETRLGRRKINAPGVPRDIADGWTAVVRRVAKSADTTDTNTLDIGSRQGSVNSVGTFEQVRLVLSPAAAALVTKLQEQVEPRLGTGGDLHSIADWAGRHHGRVVRIAGLLHLCDHQPEEPISEATMAAAVRVGAYLLEHGVAALAGSDAELRGAVRWLEKRAEPSVTQRDLHRGPLAARGTAEDAATLAERLEALGVLRHVAVEHQGPGRPPSPTYQVHPDLAAGAPPAGRPPDEPLDAGEKLGAEAMVDGRNGHGPIATPAEQARLERAVQMLGAQR